MQIFHDFRVLFEIFDQKPLLKSNTFQKRKKNEKTFTLIPARSAAQNIVNLLDFHENYPDLATNPIR